MTLGSPERNEVRLMIAKHFDDKVFPLHLENQKELKALRTSMDRATGAWLLAIVLIPCLCALIIFGLGKLTGNSLMVMHGSLYNASVIDK